MRKFQPSFSPEQLEEAPFVLECPVCQQPFYSLADEIDHVGVHLDLEALKLKYEEYEDD